jgi:hypothetical protein
LESAFGRCLADDPVPSNSLKPSTASKFRRNHLSEANRSTVVGVFENDDQARRAVNEMEAMGFNADQIGYAGHDKGGVPEDKATDVAGGAATGAVGGGVIGGVLGALAAGLIPGIGPIVGAGILTATVVGAGAGAAAGGLLGGLTGLGVSEDDAKYYEGEFKSGRSLVAVKAEGRYDEVKSRLRQLGAYDTEQRRVA